MHKKASDMASVIILTMAAVLLVLTISVYAAYTAYAVGFNLTGRDQSTGRPGADGSFVIQSRDYWKNARQMGILGGSSGSGGTAACGCGTGAVGNSRETSGDY